jgi:hypothetical protein
MSTNINYLGAAEHTNDLLREAQPDDVLHETRRRRHHATVRHVAVIRAAGAHFKVTPIRALPVASGALPLRRARSA